MVIPLYDDDTGLLVLAGTVSYRITPVVLAFENFEEWVRYLLFMSERFLCSQVTNQEFSSLCTLKVNCNTAIHILPQDTNLCL